jgi:hypothetical protein
MDLHHQQLLTIISSVAAFLGVFGVCGGFLVSAHVTFDVIAHPELQS